MRLANDVPSIEDRAGKGSGVVVDTQEDGMRPSTEMLLVGGAFALAAVAANAASSFLGTAPTNWSTAVAYGLGLGIVVFLVRFVDGETAAQGSVEQRIARLEKAVTLLTSEGAGAAAASGDAGPGAKRGPS